ncbi:MAG: helical backbone metal receptor [Pseudomonadota bacterium]
MTLLQDAIGQSFAPYRGEARIVSLVPSLTELVADLGLAQALVGRTGFCIHPREVVRTIPKLGGTKDVDLEGLRVLAPTHVLVNMDENRREQVEEIARFVPHVIVTDPVRPEDNLELYRLVGGIFGATERAAALASELWRAHEEALAVGQALPQERVLYLIWRKPWMTVSPHTYISAMLKTVGWITVPDRSARRYPEVDFAHHASLRKTQRLLLASEPYRFREKHLAEVAGVPQWRDLPAMLIDGEMVSWYGSRAIAGLRYLAALRRQVAQS